RNGLQSMCVETAKPQVVQHQNNLWFKAADQLNQTFQTVCVEPVCIPVDWPAALDAFGSMICSEVVKLVFVAQMLDQRDQDASETCSRGAVTDCQNSRLG